MLSRTIWLMAFAATFAIAVACAWDRDTLAAEAKGLPRVADVIGGRFDRNPPLYYEMRLERSLKAIEADSEDFIAYGDAAIALDKLGRPNEAVVLLEKRLNEFSRRSYADPNKNEGEHLYQLYANLGTVRAHDWVRRGADAKDTADLVKAIDEIDMAIKINPDAHFGREFVQLELMKLMLRDKGAALGEVVPEELRNLQADSFKGPTDENKKVVDGLCGMIALGAGWDSPDMFRVLARVLSNRDESVLGRLALMREEELLKRGKRPIYSEPLREGKLADLTMVENTRSDDMKRYFTALRKNGDDYHSNRTEFMLAKLKEGKHPDTHPDFWDGYVEVPPVDLQALDAKIYSQKRTKAMAVLLPAVGLTLGCVIVLVTMVASKRRRRNAV